MAEDREGFRSFLASARAALLAERTAGGYWVGELSPSALSTATAVFAFKLRGKFELEPLIRKGVAWLVAHQNADGGWGDTPISFSNISTTCLCWAALGTDNPLSGERAEGWIRASAGTLEPAPMAKVIADRYGKDRTFSVPILTMLALAGKLGADPWKLVPQLPFELAALPFWFFRIVRLPVVSYALPALIAIGQVKHRHRPTRNPLLRIVRGLAKRRTLRKLRAIQPGAGGYLEATPLTSFVAMSLIGSGNGEHEVVREGLRFLIDSVRPDGSWPIDTNLATWVTTLAVNALEGVGDPAPVRDWLLKQQFRTIHPFTRAAPGGWAWTDLPGGVPDADDTPGALLALRRLGEPDDKSLSAAAAGTTWLLDLQNRDGGIPTFCKGWTGLPFDRSSNDLTAHALRAWAAWRDLFPPALRHRIDRGTKRGLAYLLKTQRPDGAWAPLWFGNQHAAEIENLTYGTSRVLRLGAMLPKDSFDRGVAWLTANQNIDGGWGGRAGTPSSIEETALALDALADHSSDARDRGVEWLRNATRDGTHFPPSPIGFYFANLWYFEKLYPILFTAAALTRIGMVQRPAVP